MPLYEYDCPECSRSFELRLPMAEANTATCPHCGSQHPKRHLARVAIKTSAASETRGAEHGSSGCGCGGNCACGRHSSLN